MSGVEGMTVDGLRVLRPLWLLGLLALPLLAWAWRKRQRRRHVWRDLVDPHLLPHLLEGGGAPRARSGLWLGLGAIALACIALAGPSWRRVEQPLWHTRAPLVVALDLSSAALTGDLPPSRLAQARAELAQLLQHRQGGQLALVAYAEDAYTVAPLTDDVANIALFLDALDPDVMPEDGSRAARAIAWSQRLLRQAGFAHGDILLLTSGADDEARRAAAEAARAGYRVSALGLGTAAGAAFRRPDGSIGQSRLDAASLQRMASAGGGAYAALTPDAADLDALGVLDPARAGARASQGTKGAAWQDEGFWLLPPLLLLAALGFRRGAAFAVLALCLWLPLAPVRAQQPAPRASTAPRPAPQGTLWQRADQQAYQRMRAGREAYRKGDYAAASKAYAGVDSADGGYNLGNALAKQGRYEEAIAAYDRALAKAPHMADAIANRQAVRDAMQRKPAEGANRNQPNPRNRQGGQAQSRPGGQGDPSRQDPQEQRNAQPPQPPQRPPQQRSQTDDRQPRAAQDGSPRSQADQGAADAAQRERMRKALEQQQAERQAHQGKDIDGKPDRAEQAAQRERSIANDAWLRRVPDDPGALLRAKFQLEYERRKARGED